MSPAPPRLAVWLLARLTPASEREFALGDLQEQYADRHEQDAAAARRWYWLQVRRGLRHRFASRPDHGAGEARGGLLQDARYATRGLVRNPGFAALAIATLALGIGANTMIFAVVDAVLVRGLPFADAERLVVLRNGYADGQPGVWLVSFPDYVDYRTGVDGLEDLAAWRDQQPALSSDDGRSAQRLYAVDATANLLPMLGVRPILGRGFSPEEDAPDAPQRAALLSFSLWQSRFGADEGVLGRRILLDEIPFTVIGVLPRGFTGVTGGQVLPSVPTEIWLSYRSSFAGTATATGASSSLDLRGLTNVNLIGKLAEGATLAQVQQEVDGVTAALDERFPEDRTNVAARLIPAQEKAVEGVREPILVVFGAVSLLLVIACTNVANLLIGRASTRRREMAVRRALGAGRRRLVRLLIVESVVLAAASTAVAAALAAMGLRALNATSALEIARLDAAAMDLRVVLFLGALALAAGILFGVGPALFATRESPAESLRAGGRAVAGGRDRARRALVVAQIALAAIMLIGAGLMIRSMVRVLEIDPGFDPGDTLTARVQLPMGFVSAQWPEAIEFFRRFEERAAQLPGVTAVASAYQLPTDDGWNNGFEFDASASEGLRAAPDDDAISARFRPVTPGYFELLGIQLLRGRTLQDSDTADAARVVVVNEAFVRRYFEPGASALGTRILHGNWWAGGPPEYEIVGVVQDVRFSGRTEMPVPAMYFPHAQQPVREMSILVRTAGDPLALAPALRRVVAELDPGQPLDDLSRLRDRLAAHESQQRSLAALLSLFAATALVLAAVGVYGVMAFLVASRIREMGIRVALGAQRRDVRALVLRSAGRLVMAGLVIGLAVAAMLGGLIERLLYGVPPGDPVTFAAAGGFLLLVAVVAAWLPARRATAADPMRALRSD